MTYYLKLMNQPIIVQGTLLEHFKFIGFIFLHVHKDYKTEFSRNQV